MKGKVSTLVSFLAGASFNLTPVSAQWVTTHDPLAQPDLPKPTVFTPYVDQKFGTTVERITNARFMGFPGIVPQYSKRQAWNSDESLMITLSCDGRILLLNGTTYEYVKTLNGVGGEDIFWHPTNSSLIYYCPDSVLSVYNVETDQQTEVHAFTEYSFANTRGEGNLSNDGRYYAFVGVMYNGTTGETTFKDLVVYDISANSIIKKMPLPGSLADFDWVSISPLGNYVVVDYATSDSARYNGVEVYDRMFNFKWQRPLGAGHSDLGIDGNGDEVLVMDVYDGESNRTYLKKFRLSDGKETTLLDLSPHFDLHTSCRNESRRGWCFISTFDFVTRLTDDSQSWLPFEDEIFALKMDGSGDVQRLAHHHSRRYSPTTPDMDSSVYYAEPHATVSRHGDRILFGSNWRQQVEIDTSIDSYILDFRKLVNVNDDRILPTEVMLGQNYPNPFNPTTNFELRIGNFSAKGGSASGGEFVSLKVFDILGREVATLVDERRQPGVYTVRWEASALPSGVYFYRLNAGNFVQTKKMILMK